MRLTYVGGGKQKKKKKKKKKSDKRELPEQNHAQREEAETVNIVKVNKHLQILGTGALNFLLLALALQREALDRLKFRKGP